MAVPLASGPIRGHFWCRSGAVAIERMDIVDFIAFFTPTYGGCTEIIPRIYGVDSIDAHKTGLTQKSSYVRALFRPVLGVVKLAGFFGGSLALTGFRLIMPIFSTRACPLCSPPWTIRTVGMPAFCSGIRFSIHWIYSGRRSFQSSRQSTDLKCCLGKLQLDAN